MMDGRREIERKRRVNGSNEGLKEKEGNTV